MEGAAGGDGLLIYKFGISMSKSQNYSGPINMCNNATDRLKMDA